ncbi:MAG: HdeD family acid-resistance protein [Gemmatimonadetes bacterium]|nr:HdeD family acid-resistance protein [Gemmatimonadota bacterium]
MPRITQLTSNWWALALRGILSILVGILALTRPGATLAAIVILLGAYMFVDGVFAIMASLRGMRTGDRWGWMLVEGLIGIVAGLVVLRTPATGALVLLWLVAFWAITHGIAEIAAGIKLRKIIEGEWLLILAGVLSLGLGLYILMRPGVGLLLLATWVGVYALFAGIVMLMLALKVRKWTHEHP